MDRSSFNKEIKIEYRNSKEIAAQKIKSLYQSISWKDKTEETITEYLQKSIIVISAWDGEKLIGLARATEGAYKEVNIWDVAVKPQYQKKGIGSQIMKSMLTMLDDYGVPVVTLYAEPGKENFYEKFGFENHATRMMAMTRKNIYSGGK